MILPAIPSPFWLPDVANYPVNQQHEGPGVPQQVKDIDRFFQGSGRQHSDLFHDMRLGIKRSKTEEQRKGDENLVVKQRLHDWHTSLRRIAVEYHIDAAIA